MQRRALLSSLAASSAALAGCQGLSSDTQTTTPADEATTTQGDDQGDQNGPNGDEPDGEWPGDLASVVTLETQPRTLSLFMTSYRSPDGGAVSIEFVESATENNPAEVRVTLENANDFSNVFRLPDHPPLDRIPDFFPEPADRVIDESASEDATEIYLAPLPDQQLPEASPGYARDPAGVWRLEHSPEGAWLPSTHRLDAGESVIVSFALVGGPDGRGPFAVGQRRKPGGAGGEQTAVTLSAWHTDHPGPAVDSRFAGESFPELPTHDENQTAAPAWFHEATGDQSVSLRPTVEHTDLPKTLGFRLVNHATKPATGNPYYWKLYKLAAGEWHELTPQGYPAALGALAPGDAKTHRLRAANGEALPCSDGHTVGYLGGGTYAFEVGLSVADRNHAAVFELAASPVTVDPVDGATSTRDGDTVTVTGPAWDDAHGQGIVTVTRADSADDLLVPELAARRHHFRNTFPFFAEDVTTVKYRTSDTIARSAQNVGRIRFHGSAYEFSGQEQTDTSA
jgi:hypothetical protein